MSYKIFLSSISFLLLGGCGYTFQTSQSPLLIRQGIRKIYVAEIVNNTFKTGVESLVYDDLIRTLASQGAIILVTKKSDADAILTGSVVAAAYSPSALTSVSGLNPQSVAQTLGAVTISGTSIGSLPIATEYMATLTCSFSLSGQPKWVAQAESISQLKAMKGTLKETASKGPDSLPLQPVGGGASQVPIRGLKQYSWGANFTRNKTFPGSNQLDVPGTTSALINGSEFERALSDLSRTMMVDVQEAMLSMF